MPLRWRLRVLETRLRDRLARDVQVVESDLYALGGAERDAALDALVTGVALPLVLMGDVLVCSGTLDPEVIAAAILAACDALDPRADAW